MYTTTYLVFKIYAYSYLEDEWKCNLNLNSISPPATNNRFLYGDVVKQRSLFFGLCAY
jgi:hypothetical protein